VPRGETLRMPNHRPPDSSPAQVAGSEPHPESKEREAAWSRGRAAVNGVRAGAGTRSDVADLAALSGPSFTDNCREYAMFILDLDGIIRIWGESARLMKWWTKDEAEGAHLRLLYPDGGAEDGTAESHLQIAGTSGEFTGEGHRVRSDGSTFWARVTVTALKEPGGPLRGFAKVVRDATGERAAHATAAQATQFSVDEQKRVEERSRARGLFAATVSHEIRGPLNAILGYLKLLEHETAGPLSEPQRAHIARIQKIGTHLLAVLKDVLDESRLEAGRFVVTGALGRLGAAIDAAVVVAQPEAVKKGVILENAVAGYGAEVTYFGDEGRVRQILINLLVNSVKFTPTGGSIKVSAGLAETASPDAELVAAGPFVYVRVEDTGEGISPDRLLPIFEPFEQARDDVAREHGGSGLGLSISRRLARAMGGDLTVRSEVSRGSAFFLWLPAADTRPANE
jgi:PAS domain S-box-containing protein